jgi:hypothetical protein
MQTYIKEIQSGLFIEFYDTAGEITVMFGGAASSEDVDFDALVVGNPIQIFRKVLREISAYKAINNCPVLMEAGRPSLAPLYERACKRLGWGRKEYMFEGEQCIAFIL